MPIIETLVVIVVSLVTLFVEQDYYMTRESARMGLDFRPRRLWSGLVILRLSQSPAPVPRVQRALARIIRTECIRAMC